MSRISETPKGVLETYDWQDVAEDLKEQLQEANENITWWKDRWTAQVNLRKEYFEENEHLRTELNTLKSKINEAIEYITSYEAISIIQGLDRIEQNKTLDERTMNVMVERYLQVHHNLLNILQNGSDN